VILVTGRGCAGSPTKGQAKKETPLLAKKVGQYPQTKRYAMYGHGLCYVIYNLQVKEEDIS
jgi:hypothetical protein